MNKTRRNIIICVIIILIVILPVIYINIDNSDIKAILLGIISSIIASSIFNIFSAFVFENKTEQVETLKEIIANTEAKSNGILDIKKRTEFASDFWIKFAKTTNKEWTISGRTLNRWLGNDIKEDFKMNILRILKGKGEINFIIYKNLDGAEAKEKEFLHDFLNKEIFPTCVTKTKNNRYVIRKDTKLTIYEVDNLPYLYNANENEIIVAPYFTYIENSNNIMFVFKHSCEYGTEYSRDFQYVIRDASKNTWLDDYLEKINRR